MKQQQTLACSRRPAPLWLLAELTCRCPLHCPFCFNPVDHAHARSEPGTAERLDVLRQARAEAEVAAARERIGNRMRILFVVPDYFEERPKACMNGWAACTTSGTPAAPSTASAARPG